MYILKHAEETGAQNCDKEPPDKITDRDTKSNHWDPCPDTRLGTDGVHEYIHGHNGYSIQQDQQQNRPIPDLLRAGLERLVQVYPAETTE